MFFTFIGFLIVFYYAIKIIRRKLCTPQFHSKTIWITGGSSGLGEFLAYEISKRDVGQLILSARNIVQLERVKNNCKDPSKIRIVKMDMSDFEGVRKTTDRVLRDLQQQNSKLDIMIENAGISMHSDFVNFDFQNHLSLIDVNINGIFNHIQAILPHMTKNKNGQIVSISSVLSKFDFANRSSQISSKFGINALMDSLRAQVSAKNIVVTNILPGYVQKKISEKAEKYNQNSRFLNTEMKPGNFAEEATRAIYMRENEVHVSKNWIVNPLRILARGVFPDLGFLLSIYFNKSSIKRSILKLRNDNQKDK